MTWKESPRGLIQPAEKSKVVVFHAILPASLWDWDSESEVYIRFGHPYLGNWQCDCGPMTLKRYVLKITLHFDVILLFALLIGTVEME